MSAVKTQLYRYATPLTFGLFLISAISGTALFVHLGANYFREMHEILSMVLLVPFGLHVWRNWLPMMNYFRRAAMPLSLAACLLAAGGFVYASGSGTGGGNPAFALMQSAQTVPLSSLAPVLKLDPEAAVKRLRDAGLASVTTSDSIADIAARSGQDGFELLGLLTRQPAT